MLLCTLQTPPLKSFQSRLDIDAAVATNMYVKTGPEGTDEMYKAHGHSSAATPALSLLRMFPFTLGQSVFQALVTDTMHNVSSCARTTANAAVSAVPALSTYCI